MKVLVVEDSSSKLERVCAALVDDTGVRIEDVVTRGDTNQARMALRGDVFDVLIMDIALPPRADEPVRRDAGLLLLDELLQGRTPTPSHIVVLSEHDDLILEIQRRFVQGAFTVIRYEAASDAWGESIKARIRLVAAAKVSTWSRGFECSLCIVCALDDPELNSVLQLPWRWSQHIENADDTIYWRGTFNDLSGAAHSVYAASSGRMGMPAAAIVTTKMIDTFAPRVVVMGGITAGVAGRVSFGDVIVGDPVLDYGSGKWVADGGGSRFQPAPYQFALEAGLRSRFRLLASDRASRDAIKATWSGDAPSNELRLKVGPLASGAAVLADGRTLERIMDQQRDVLGVEMEAYAVYAAAAESRRPRPRVVAVKSVVDFADGAKNDAWQTYASHMSAHVIRYAAENGFFN